MEPRKKFTSVNTDQQQKMRDRYTKTFASSHENSEHKM